MASDAWRADAQCRTADGSHDPNFFPEVGRKTEMRAIAKGKCSVCPVRGECLDWALSIEGNSDANHRYGITGGMDPTERAAENLKRKQEEQNRAAL